VVAAPIRTKRKAPAFFWTRSTNGCSGGAIGGGWNSSGGFCSGGFPPSGLGGSPSLGCGLGGGFGLGFGLGGAFGGVPGGGAGACFFASSSFFFCSASAAAFFFASKSARAFSTFSISRLAPFSASLSMRRSCAGVSRLTLIAPTGSTTRPAPTSAVRTTIARPGIPDAPGGTSCSVVKPAASGTSKASAAGRNSSATLRSARAPPRGYSASERRLCGPM
jgi:hypothetical protein